MVRNTRLEYPKTSEIPPIMLYRFELLVELKDEQPNIDEINDCLQQWGSSALVDKTVLHITLEEAHRVLNSRDLG